MVKTKKARVRKTFNYGVSRKKKAKQMKKRLTPTVNRASGMSTTWKDEKSADYNFDVNGIVFNLNKYKKPDQREKESIVNETASKSGQKTNYASALQSEVQQIDSNKFAYTLSPKNIELIYYYLDKYGEDYKAMSRDIRNYDQHTWKQIRRNIQQFKQSSDQYAQFLKKRNLLN